MAIANPGATLYRLVKGSLRLACTQEKFESTLADLDELIAETEPKDVGIIEPIGADQIKPARRPLPAALPRDVIEHAARCDDAGACIACIHRPTARLSDLECDLSPTPPSAATPATFGLTSKNEGRMPFPLEELPATFKKGRMIGATVYPAAIDGYSAPRTIAGALLDKQRFGESGMFLAGGMSAMQAMKARMLRPANIIDLNDVDEMRGVSATNDVVTVGGMTRYREVAASTLLSGALHALRDAAGHVGDRQVRNRGTIGGSLCWNYVSACTPPTVLALGGVIELVSSRGRRHVPAHEFLLGPFETFRGEDELLVAVRFRTGARTGSAYRKWGLVADALPIVGIGASVVLNPEKLVETASIALVGLQSGTSRLPAVERGLVGLRRQDVSSIRSVLDDYAANADVPGDHFASAEYRRALIASLGAEVLDTAFARAGA